MQQWQNREAQEEMWITYSWEKINKAKCSEIKTLSIIHKDPFPLGKGQVHAQASYDFCLAPWPKNTFYDVESASAAIKSNVLTIPNKKE